MDHLGFAESEFRRFDIPIDRRFNQLRLLLLACEYREPGERSGSIERHRSVEFRNPASHLSSE